MPQFYPDGPAAVSLNSLRESGGINVPEEPSAEFDTPGMQGSMQQLLSENLGKYVMADFLIGVSNIVRRVGVLYSVGRGFVVLYDENTHVFDVCDIFSLKFVAFFPPGFEPTLEELLSGAYPSGILSPYAGNPLAPADTSAMFGGGSMRNMAPVNNPVQSGSMGGGAGARSSSGNGCRTLGQR